LNKFSSLKRFSGSDQTHILFAQTRFLLSICNFTVSLRRARECENNPPCILIFPRPPRYQSCSRAARISFLHNIRVHARFCLCRRRQRSIKRLNKVRGIRFDIVISDFRKTFQRSSFRRSIHAQNPIVICHFRTYLKRIGMLNNVICSHSFFIYPEMVLTILTFSIKILFIHICL